MLKYDNLSISAIEVNDGKFWIFNLIPVGGEEFMEAEGEVLCLQTR